MSSLKFIATMALATMTLGSSAQQQVYVVNEWGDLYTVDLVTCASTWIGNTGLSVFDIAYCPVSGLLYGVTEYSELYIIDPADASVEFVGYTDLILNALVCDELGTLYAACQYDDGIYTVDPMWGSTNLVGSTCTGLVSGGDLTFYNGELYWSTSTNELVQVNLEDPCASVVVGTFGGVGDVYGIVSVLDCSQHLYVSSGSGFFALDMTTLGATAQCNWVVPGGIYGAASTTETATELALQAAGPFCQADPAEVLQVSVPGGTWSATCGSCINSATGLFEPSAAGSGAWTVTYTRCGIEYQMELVVQATTATLTSAGPFCITDPPVQLTASPSGGSWAGLGIIGASSGLFDPAVAGAGTHLIAYLPLGPCAVAATLQITVSEPGGVTIQAVGPFCADAPPVLLQASMAGGLWTGQGILNATTGLFDPSVAGQGQHLIAYGPASGSCAFGGSTMVAVNPLPTLSTTAFGPFCLNHGELPEPVIVADMPGTAFFDFPVGWNSSLSIGEGLHSIGCSYTTENGCVTDTVLEFEVNDTTAVDYTLPDLCSNASPVALAPYVEPAGGAFFVDYGNGVWTGPVVQFAPASALSYPDEATAYPVRFTFTNAMGCSSLNPSTITLQPVPHPSFIHADICVDDTLAVTNTSTIGSGAISSWAWSFSGQPPVFGAAPEPFICGIAEPLVIHLVATSDHDCSATWMDTAYVHPAPVADFSTAGHCEEDTVHYIDLSAMPTNSFWEAIQSRQWRFGSGGTSMAQDPILLPGLWGEFLDTLIVTSNFGCSDTAVHMVRVYPVPDIGILAASHCLHDSADFYSLTTIPEGAIDSTWWEVEGDTVMGTAATHLFSSAGFFPITLHTVSDQGCEVWRTDSVEVWPLPLVGFSLSDTGICTNAEVFLHDASSIAPPYANTAWTWTVSGVPMATGPSADLVFADAGTYAIGLTVISANGCSATAASDAELIVHPLPVAGFNTEPGTATMMDPEIRFVDTGSGTVEWFYDFGDGEGATQQHPVHSYTTHGLFNARQIVTSEYGCSDTAYEEVVIEPEVLVYVPNAFTPDGDGVNDVFLPILYGFDVRSYRLTVWNRWGEPIFETADENRPWDGRAAGASEVVQDGVYVWQLDLAAQDTVVRRSMTGHVTLVR